jgi:hypothetical protein
LVPKLSGRAAPLISFLILVTLLGGACAAPPSGWLQPEIGSRGVEVTVDRSVFHDGKASLSLRATASEGRAFGICSQWIRADHYRGRRVRLSGYLKTQDVGPTRHSGARLDLMVFGKTNAFGGSGMRGRLIQGTTAWTRYERVVDVPEAADVLVIAIVLTGPGQLWADDLKLEKVGQEVPVTAGSDRRPELSEEMKQRVQTRLRTAPRRPVNLGFEH